MKLIIWAAAEEAALKEEAEVITAEEADVATEEYFMVLDEESNMKEEAGKTQDINGPDPMPEWYSVTIARRWRFILPMTS